MYYCQSRNLLASLCEGPRNKDIKWKEEKEEIEDYLLLPL